MWKTALFPKERNKEAMKEKNKAKLKFIRANIKSKINTFGICNTLWWDVGSKGTRQSVQLPFLC